ncbi:MAG: hypothetical protein A3G38_00635 [Omnitrophica WOR_2 bacterium RIFCSPLOWO2_12_FULL_51_8]|nr:MAG: hypothetical protein A3G38_00635 [Omnitrophica WOR_2 bacterium RIFCSPLOWO2_12_FULL_51_8]
MAKIPEEAKEFLTTHLAYVATADEKGRPNVVPKGEMAILDTQTIVFADLYSHQTKRNLTKNPHIAITVVNPAAYRGYQFKGKAKIIERGEAFDRIAGQVRGYGELSHPDAKYAVKVSISKVIDISYGDTGDKELQEK